MLIYINLQDCIKEQSYLCFIRALQRLLTIHNKLAQKIFFSQMKIMLETDLS